MGVSIGVIRNVAVGLVVSDGWVLVERYPGSPGEKAFLRAIGGGVEFGERTADAIVREFREELDASVRVVRLLAVSENLFTWEGEPAHEIVHVFEVESPDLAALPKDASLRVLDQTTTVGWHRLEDLASGSLPFYPDGVLEIAQGLTEGR